MPNRRAKPETKYPRRTIWQTMKEYMRPYYLKWLYFRLGSHRTPEHFKRCWQYAPADGSARDAGQKADLIFLPMVDWHVRMQRTQHLALGLAESGYRCFFVSPHLGRQFPATYLGSHRLAVNRLAEDVFEVHIHLPAEPVYHHRRLRPLESEQIAASLEKLLRSWGSKRAILIASFPVWVDVIRSLRNKLNVSTVYDCHDHLGGFRNVAPEIVEDEADVMAESDLILFSAESLLSSVTGKNPDIARKALLLRNGADPGHFQPRASPESGPAKVIGYAGALDWWFHVELVRHAAVAHPEWRFLLIGRLEHAGVKRLGSLKNVELRGEVPYAELPRHVCEFDVAMIPFVLCPLTAATDPIKLYEYFSCGLPVVSTRLQELESFEELLYIADEPDGFVRKIEAALCEEPSRRAQRIALARRGSWSRQCRELSGYLERLEATRVSVPEPSEKTRSD